MPSENFPFILLFLKAPRLGFVKTRLAKDIGNESACQAYREMVAHTLSQIPSSWPLRIHFAPADAEPEMTQWLGGRPTYIPQPEGDLGKRLQTACAEAFAAGAPSVILLGGDCPRIRTSHLTEAHTSLAAGQDVIGPAQDGGYWLLGLTESRPELFSSMPWSTEQVFPITLDRFKNASHTPRQLETLEDVDEQASWDRNRPNIILRE